MLKGFVSGEEKDIKRIPMKGKQLFDSSVYTSGYNIASNGEIVENSNYSLSGYIFVAAGTYTLSGKNTYNTTANIANRAVLYDENKENPVIVLSATGAKPVDFDYTIQIPKSGFLVFAFRTTDINIMLNSGSAPLPYEPYGYQEGWEVRDSQDRLIWGREDELQTATGTLPFKGYALQVKPKSLLGNAVQNGTPAPDNIITPEMCGVRTGNLFNINATPTKYSQSTTVTVDGQTLTITGTWYIYYEIDVAPNTDYYVKWTIDYAEIEGRGSIAILTTSGQPIHNQSTSPYSFNSGENQRIRLLIYSASSTSATVRLSNIMLNLGSTALPYEPCGWKIPFENHGENLWSEDYTGIDGNLKYVPVFVGDGTFTMSTDTPDYSGNAPLFLLSGNVVSGASTPINGVYNGVSKTVNSSNGYVTIAFRRPSELADPTTHKTMLTPGSTPKPYSPYLNETIPVYLGEVPTVRRVKKLVLDGNEWWGKEGGVLFFNDVIVQMPAVQYADAYCSHYRLGSSYTDVAVKEAAFGVSKRPAVFFHDTRFSTVGDFKTYLQQQYAAGTPVTVWYVLANEQTGVVNEPLAKIGTYADELTTIKVHGLSAPLYGIGDYKDTLNLSTGVVTRKVKKLVLDGTEKWALWSSGQPDVERYYYKWGKSTPSDYGLICTHLPFRNADGNFEHIRLGGSSRDDFVIYISKTIAPTVTDFKAYLTAQYQAGTPVTAWYVLSTPTTETVTVPTGMTGEIEGYLTQISIPTPEHQSIPKWNGKEETDGTYAVTVYTLPEIPTTTGKNTLTVDTTLAPSNLTVKGHIKPIQ